MRLTVVRHTSVNVSEGTCYGFTDVPLTPSFDEEASVVKEQLKGETFDKVYSSPLSRCMQLADYCGFPNPELDVRIKELNFGDWEMKSWMELDPVEARAWFADWLNYSPPRGESYARMQERINAFLDELKTTNHKSCCLFTHGGVIRLIHVYLGICSLENSFEFPVEYGQIFHLKL
ncbi:MAG: alpha-ribazole phosphatase [Dysgonamonadaceae bacterium]|nr:alpha-ribazole phosphatase [Dysgonamonadaceae bacterium]